MADYTTLKEAVINGKAAQVKELTQQALSAGAHPQDILDQALILAMDVVGQKFSCAEFFIPEMMISARAMQAGVALLMPHLAEIGAKAKGKVVLGTVKGDLHDIGKNLVGMMLQGSGFQVIDLGADVKPQQFVEAVQAEKPDFVMMSALLTTTMLSMGETIQALKAVGIREKVRVGVGGAAVNQRFADQIGADFYAPTATGGVAKAKALIGV